MESLLVKAKESSLMARIKNGHVEILVPTCDGTICASEWVEVNSEDDISRFGH